VIRRADVATRRSGFIFALSWASDPLGGDPRQCGSAVESDSTARFLRLVFANPLGTSYTDALVLLYFTRLYLNLLNFS
jgi:hypothetical protein